MHTQMHTCVHADTCLLDAQIHPQAWGTPHSNLRRHTSLHRCTRVPGLTALLLQAPAHACPHTPVQLAGPITRQSPHPHPFISLWTVASRLDQRQGVGAGRAEAADGDGTSWGEEALHDLGCLERAVLHRAACPPPRDEELINLMN